MTGTASTGVPTGTVIGLDPGPGGLREADHLLHALARHLSLPETAFACTHRVPDAPGRVSLSLALPDEAAAEASLDRLAAVNGSLGALPAGVRAVLGNRRLPLPDTTDGYGAAPEGWTAARAAAAEGTARTGGRAVVFPGSAGLPTVLTVGELLERSAVTAVEVLGGTPADPTAELDTRSHLRPEWRAGVLVLKLVLGPRGLPPLRPARPTPVLRRARLMPDESIPCARCRLTSCSGPVRTGHFRPPAA
ncbi:hypothetical protein LUW77_00610 [Streptomyces radiopugnans]|nr:hypothetical protein LUW77_00610 [Streptomyces radiopugnans]